MNYHKLALLIALFSLSSCKQANNGPKPVIEIPVLVDKVKEQDVPVYIFAVGNAKASNEADIKPQISGIVSEVNMVDGQKVKKGQLLYTIDPRPFDAVLEKTKGILEKDKASLQLAEATLKRYGQLVKEDYVSKLNYDTYSTNVQTQKAQVLSDEADVKTAQINLDYTHISAPFDGILSEHQIDEGNLVTAEQTLLTNIAQVDPLEIRFGIAQKDYELFRSVHPRPKIVEISLPTENEKYFPGTIFFVDNKISRTTGTVLLKARMANPQHELWPGEFVKVKLQLKKVKGAMVMPLGALQYGQSGPFVYIVKPDMTVEVRPVDIVTKNEAYIATSTGFKPGELVVTDGQINLRPGVKVKIKDETEKKVQK